MSVRIIYSAIPPQSDLYACLREDLTFNTLMCFLMSSGHELYRFSGFASEDFTSEDIKESLASLLKYNPSVLGPEPEQSIDSFFAILEKTRADYPSLEERVVALEKCASEIEGKLQQALKKTHAETSAKMVSQMMWGDGILHPTWSQPGRKAPVGESVLGLISPSTVRKGALALAPLDVQQLFPDLEGRDSWYQAHYERWQRVYLAAAEHGEAFILGFS